LGSELAPPQPKPHFWGSPRENPSWYQIKTLVRCFEVQSAYYYDDGAEYS